MYEKLASRLTVSKFKHKTSTLWMVFLLSNCPHVSYWNVIALSCKWVFKAEERIGRRCYFDKSLIILVFLPGKLKASIKITSPVDTLPCSKESFARWSKDILTRNMQIPSGVWSWESSFQILSKHNLQKYKLIRHRGLLYPSITY